MRRLLSFVFFQAEDGIRAGHVTGVQTCALPISVVSPDDALTRASTFLRDHFAPLTTGAPEEDEEAEAASGEAYLRETLGKTQIGRASCRERVEPSVGAGAPEEI